MNNEAADETQVDALLDESSDGVDMSGTVTVLDSKHVYQGAIFGVDDMRIALPMPWWRANGDSSAGDAPRALRGHAGA